MEFFKNYGCKHYLRGNIMCSTDKLKPINRDKIMAVISLVSAIILLGNSGYMSAKASLAQILIHHAWDNLQQDHNIDNAKPWPWADTFPIAKLSANKQILFVLNSTSGESLSFGPGHYPQSVLPGDKGDSVIAAHRDTHFAFLKNMVVGDIITAENYLGGKQNYQVQNIKIVNSSKEQLNINPSQNRLQLVTCYPFDALVAGGPLRYLVSASVIK